MHIDYPSVSNEPLLVGLIVLVFLIGLLGLDFIAQHYEVNI